MLVRVFFSMHWAEGPETPWTGFQVHRRPNKYRQTSEMTLVEFGNRGEGRQTGAQVLRSGAHLRK